MYVACACQNIVLTANCSLETDDETNVDTVTGWTYTQRQHASRQTKKDDMLEEHTITSVMMHTRHYQ